MNPMRCLFCPAAFKTSVALQAHAVYSHPAGFYTCAWCSDLIENEAKVKIHATTCTELTNRQEVYFEAFCINDTQCNICDATFASHQLAINHYKELHLHCTYICGICTKYFRTQDTFGAHMVADHPDEQTPFPSTSAAELSLNAEKPRKQKISRAFNEKRCFDCNIQFERFTEIVEHFRDKHDYAMHSCGKCEKGYTCEVNLQYHDCRVAAKRRSSTKRCSSTKRYSRVNIMALKEDFKRNYCGECEVSFGTADAISDHFRDVHFEMFRCDKCDTLYKNVRKFTDHNCDHVSMTHKDKFRMLKDFRRKHCSLCNISFENDDECMEHFQSRHRFKISICQKCGSPTSNLVNHRCAIGLSHGRLTSASSDDSDSTHHRDEPKKGEFSCAVCPYIMPTYAMGLNHYAEEHDIFIFECPAPKCSQLFRRFSKWARHFLKAHGFVELSADSAFRTLLDDIMHQVYRKVMNETGTVATNDSSMQMDQTTSTPMNETTSAPMNLETSTTTCSSHDVSASGSGDTSTTTTTSTEMTSDADYTNADMDLEPTPPVNITDSDVEIVEWMDIADIKPHIKPEL